MNLPWNSLAIVVIQIKDASSNDRQPVYTTFEKRCDERASLGSHKKYWSIINRKTSQDRENKSCVSGRFIRNTTNSKSNFGDHFYKTHSNQHDLKVNVNGVIV